jgi:hypothetical protein
MPPPPAALPATSTSTCLSWSTWTVGCTILVWGASSVPTPTCYVQDPTYSQSLNRYSYVWNNPLVFYDPSGYTWFSRAWKWVKRYWQPTAVFGLYGGLKYDEGKQKGYSNLEAWLYAGAQTAIAAIAAYAGTYVVSKVGAMLPFGGF